MLKKKNSEKVYARVVHILTVYRVNSILQAGKLSVIEGSKELVNQDSSLMPCNHLDSKKMMKSWGSQ